MWGNREHPFYRQGYRLRHERGLSKKMYLPLSRREGTPRVGKAETVWACPLSKPGGTDGRKHILPKQPGQGTEFTVLLHLPLPRKTPRKRRRKESGRRRKVPCLPRGKTNPLMRKINPLNIGNCKQAAGKSGMLHDPGNRWTSGGGCLCKRPRRLF